MSTGCTENRDPLILVREGTSQGERISPALDPEFVSVNERKPEHVMMFAKAYAGFLRYYETANFATEDWKPFFSNDVSVQLATAAVEDVEYYKSQVREYFDFLNDRSNQFKPEVKANLGYLFSCIATLARELDRLGDKLPVGNVLKDVLQNLIQTQLASAFRRLISYYKADEALPTPSRLIGDTHPGLNILGGATVPFGKVYADGLSDDWKTENSGDWSAYTAAIPADPSVYGSAVVGTDVFAQANHIATHNLFTSIFDQFLKAYVRIVSEAKLVLEKTFTGWDGHEPHYALFLAYLRLFEFARAEMNTLTGRHLDLYYREILRLSEKPAEPGQAHLLVELANHAPMHQLKAGELVKAGKDGLGVEAFFANDRDFVANQAKVAALKTVYRHGDEEVGDMGADPKSQIGRLFASPVANSDDGLGAELTSADKSWHPFSNKTYQGGELKAIRMPPAEIGFAIASHHLLLAEGTRAITVAFTVTGTPLADDHKDDIVCLLTSEKGWIEAKASKFGTDSGLLKLEIILSGADPPVTRYEVKTHGYNFGTALPILLVKLRHSEGVPYIYHLLQDTLLEQIDLTTDVTGLRTVAVSNDFGPVDTSKPFQPFGASPVAGSSFVVGSKELFQKNCETASLKIEWQNLPTGIIGHKKGATPSVTISSLQGGMWDSQPGTPPFSSDIFSFGNEIDPDIPDRSNGSEEEWFSIGARKGFIQVLLNENLGHVEYLNDLRAYLIGQSQTPPTGTNPDNPPYIPTIARLSVDYRAVQPISLNSASKKSFEERPASFFHLAPFGQAEQHPFLGSTKRISLLPQFALEREISKDAGELYIGVSGLKPPQNLALLFQVADGTADPRSPKPKSHIRWSYLHNNEWVDFDRNDVQDRTAELLKSGIVTLAVSRDASEGNTLLPAGMHWIRAAVASESDAVCRLIKVAAQAFSATFHDRGNDPLFPSGALPEGTITKLDRPDADVKKLTQPFATFGGRGRELPGTFYTRVSERLRHKDRAINMWDYERLILQAFPQIHRVKCLNHTQYEIDESGALLYRELAPGHVTIVTVPNLELESLRDPLRPFTSLGLLEDIDAFIRKRLPCFVKLHVKNPLFEEVKVSFNVWLKKGQDQKYAEKELQMAITRFLSPWAFPGGRNPSFGGKIRKAVLVNFVEEQPSVDYLTGFELSHKFMARDEQGSMTEITESGLSQIEGSKAVSILVSARSHDITVITPTAEEAPIEKCPCEA